MSRRPSIVTHALLAATLLSIALSGTPAQAADSKSKSSGPVIAVFKLDGPVTDKPTADDPIFGSLKSESLRSLVSRLEAAAEDDNVKAAVLMLGSSPPNLAQIEELLKPIRAIKEAGKPVHAHVTSLQSTKAYALLAGCSDISMVPTGDLWITGIYGEQLYLRGLLNKIEVTPDFLTCGAYKSAAETFMRKGPSEEAEEMYGWLYDSIYDTMLTLIAEGREVDKEQAKAWVDEGLYSAEAAQQAGLIDRVEHRQDFEEWLKSTHGSDVTFDKKYGRQKGKQIDFNNPFAAFQLWSEILAGPQTRKSTKDAIAIVHVNGPIMSGSSEPSLFGGIQAAYSDTIRKALTEVANDKSIKAVVLRVDSPGGSAVASEVILDATKRVKAKKPIVVSMGGVAGSGGYYVACGADTIFADASTITGSIGVVAGKLATTGMWDSVGINFEPIERGKNASILGTAEVFTDDQRNELQGWMNEVYEVFKGHVVAIRGDRLKKPIEELAGGRVFSGQQALEFGLVDKIGGMDDAIAFIAKEVDLQEGDYEIRTVPRPKNVLEELMADLVPTNNKDEDHLGIGLSLYEYVLPMLRGADPERITTLQAVLLQLEMLSHENVLLTMPIIEMR